MLSDVGGGREERDSECSGRPIFFYWRKTESDIILLKRNLPIDSGVRQWSHYLMIPLNCLWAESNSRTRGLLNVTWLGFVFVLISFSTCTVKLLFYNLLGRAREGSFKNGRPRSRRVENVGRRCTGGWGVSRIRQFLWTPYVYRS